VDDDALTDAWERGEQLPGGISHEQHVRIVWVLLRRHERAVAVRRLLAGYGAGVRCARRSGEV
jgi:hypothetical protein